MKDSFTDILGTLSGSSIHKRAVSNPNVLNEAYAYAKKALRGDDPEGAVRYLLGLMGYNGRGWPKDMAESLKTHQEVTRHFEAESS